MVWRRSYAALAATATNPTTTFAWWCRGPDRSTCLPGSGAQRAPGQGGRRKSVRKLPERELPKHLGQRAAESRQDLLAIQVAVGRNDHDTTVIAMDARLDPWRVDHPDEP